MSDREKFWEQQKIKSIKGPFFGPVPGSRHFHLLSERPKETIKTLKKLTKYLLKYKLFFLLTFICVIGSSILSLISPYLIGKVIDDFIISKNLINFKHFLFFMLIIYLFNSFLFYIQGITVTTVSQKIGFDIRKNAFECIHKLSLRVIDRRQIGDIMSRITNDIDIINTTLATSTIHFFSGIFMLVGTIVMMILLSPILTFYSMVLIPLMAIITKIISSKTRKYFYLQQTKLGEINGIAEEDITNLKIIKLYGKEEFEMERFEKENYELKEYGFMAQKFSGIMPPLMNFLNNLSFAIIGGIGGIYVAKEVITIGTIVSFINYVKQFTRPLNELAHQFNTIQGAISSAERIFEIMEEEKEKEDSEMSKNLEDLKKEIEFKDVFFAYENDKYILKNINFKTPFGKIIAIVGPTGAGKTTLINLLARLYEIEKGEILIDGINIKEIKKESLRSKIGIVLQDTYLFTGTIKENIKYGKLEATDEEIEMICKKINADKFIKNLPQKYDTFLSDEMQSLSQGQKQLIAIARAILSNPKILILDEATSNIDTKTEVDVQKGLLELMKGRTCFVIAHRLNTIKNADLIIVINNGEIIEIGTHKELMEKKGFYYHLFITQFGEFKPDL
ncbi:MAG: ABC transporter ATP-binding protein/permease [Candidatus Omnitrophica bacterium]|nr:ABC transporter ATP-binding protein/permease [Candidatus Omnitrophota bacterium]MCM8806854.1 ABC transporter ATP-binding protein/permease [Candidatus Omnitrophota bacterium]